MTDRSILSELDDQDDNDGLDLYPDGPGAAPDAVLAAARDNLTRWTRRHRLATEHLAMEVRAWEAEERRLRDAKALALGPLLQRQSFCAKAAIEAARFLHRQTGVMSFRTPHGTVRSRKTTVRRVVDNEAEALAWAEKHWPEAVAVKQSLLVSQLPRSGSVPGTSFTEPDRTWAVWAGDDEAEES